MDSGLLLRLVLVVALVLLIAVAAPRLRARIAKRTGERLGRVLDEPLPPTAMPDAPTVLYFYGRACASCASQLRALDALAEEQTVNVVPIDAARRPDLAEWAGVLTVPSTAVVDPARRLRAVNHGFQPTETLASQIRELAS